MKFRKWYWLLLVPILGFACFYGAKRGTIHVKAYAQVRATPFTAELVTYGFGGPNPQGQLLAGKTVARRSDGSTAELFRNMANWNAPARSVTFMNGQTIRLFDLVSSKTSWTLKPDELAGLHERLSNPPPDCKYWPDAKVVSRETWYGQPVVALARMGVFDGHTERETTWLAPQLACESLQFRAEIQQPDGTLKLDNEERLISFKAGEPDTAYFEPGTGYEEVMPSTMMQRALQKIGLQENSATKEHEKRADQMLLQHKQ